MDIAIDLTVGVFTHFPGLRPEDDHTRVWKFVNKTGVTLVDVFINTGPSAWYGGVSEVVGGTGDPPNMDRVTIRGTGWSFGTSNAGEDLFYTFLQEVAPDQTVIFVLELDDGFEEEEFIQFTFRYRFDDEVGLVPANGEIRVGGPLPRPDPGLLEEIPSAAGSVPGLLGRADIPGGEQRALIAHLGRQVERNRREISRLRTTIEAMKG